MHKNGKQTILKRLDAIEFHDVPVKKIALAMYENQFKADYTIDFALYDDKKEEYEYYTLQFKDIQSLKADSLELGNNPDMEISDFTYELKEFFECKIIFLLGLGAGVHVIDLACKEIELEKIEKSSKE